MPAVSPEDVGLQVELQAVRADEAAGRAAVGGEGDHRHLRRLPAAQLGVADQPPECLSQGTAAAAGGRPVPGPG